MARIANIATKQMLLIDPAAAAGWAGCARIHNSTMVRELVDSDDLAARRRKF